MSLYNQFNHEELYTEFFTPLFRYFLFRTKDSELSSDLTQSTFLKFLVQNNKPSTKDHSVKLLFTIARTTLIDYWRVDSKRKHESIEAEEIEPVSTLPTPERDYEIQEGEVLLRELLDYLSETEREIVTLRLTSDMSYDDISQISGISSANARQLYSRALRKVQTVLQEDPRYQQYAT